MKNAFKNRILLAVAAVLSISAVPAVAQEEMTFTERVRASLPSMPEVSNPFAGMSNPFAGWTKEGLQRQLKTTMDRLDREMKDVIKCVKSGGQQCASHRTEVLSLIATVVALVAALKVYSVGAKTVGRKTYKVGALLDSPTVQNVGSSIHTTGVYADPFRAGRRGAAAVRTKAGELSSAVGERAARLREAAQQRYQQYFRNTKGQERPPLTAEESTIN